MNLFFKIILTSSLFRPMALGFALFFTLIVFFFFKVFHSFLGLIPQQSKSNNKWWHLQKRKHTGSNCERWKSWKCQEKWHITMTTQLLSCQGCKAWSSVAMKWDPDCCSLSEIIAINLLFSTSHYSPLKLNWLVSLNCMVKNQCSIISFLHCSPKCFQIQ